MHISANAAEVGVCPRPSRLLPSVTPLAPYSFLWYRLALCDAALLPLSPPSSMPGVVLMPNRRTCTHKGRHSCSATDESEKGHLIKGHDASNALVQGLEPMGLKDCKYT